MLPSRIPPTAFLWLPLDIARSGEVLRRGAGACGRAEPPAAPQDIGNLAAHAPGHIRIASLPAAGPAAETTVPIRTHAASFHVPPPARPAMLAGPRRPPRLTGLGTVTAYQCAELPLPLTHSGLGAEPPPPRRLLGGLCSARGSVPTAVPRLPREGYEGTSGGGSGTSSRESIRISATASPWGGVGGAPGKPLGGREAHPGAGPVLRGLPATILSSSLQ